jgi:hypothetical protein
MRVLRLVLPAYLERYDPISASFYKTGHGNTTLLSAMVIQADPWFCHRSESNEITFVHKFSYAYVAAYGT